MPSWRRQIASAVGFGLLFYVYFYYWTAASIALDIAAAFDAGHRRVSLNTALIGGIDGDSLPHRELAYPDNDVGGLATPIRQVSGDRAIQRAQYSPAGSPVAGRDGRVRLAIAPGADLPLDTGGVGSFPHEPPGRFRVAGREFPLVLRGRPVPVALDRLATGRLDLGLSAP